LILQFLGKDDSLVSYKEAEGFTTKDKKVNVSKAKRDLSHNPKVALKEGIHATLSWMKKEYNIG